MRTRAVSLRDNFYYLFAELLVLMVIGPVLTELLGNLGVLIAEISLTVALVIALWSLRSSRIAFYGGVALILVNILASVAWLLLGSEPASTVSQASGLVFLVLSISRAAYQVFRPDRVNLNKIVGALCIYLLIGAIFALFFQLLENSSPGSLAGLEGHDGHALSWRLIYFSFVTLTTLGYGDTERGSGELYADLAAYDLAPLDPPFTPARYIALICEAERAGYAVLIVDSLSHAWAGEGGAGAHRSGRHGW